MNKKRLLAIIMTVILIVGLLPLSTFAEEDAQEATTATETVKEEAAEETAPAKDAKKDDAEEDAQEATTATETVKEEAAEETAPAKDAKKDDAEEDAQKATTATETVKEEAAEETAPAKDTKKDDAVEKDIDEDKEKSPAFSQFGKHTPGTLRALNAESKQVKYDKNTLDSVTDMPENVEASGATYYLSEKEPKRDHYTFDYWTTDPAGTGAKFGCGSQYTFPEGTVEVTFYAQWTVVEHDVVFDPNAGVYDGKTIPTTEKHDYDDNFQLTAATREHYQFKGWKANDAAGTVYQAGAQYHVTGDVTFTAQWECDTIDITVNTIWQIPEGLTVVYPAVPVELVASTNEIYSATLTEPYWVHTFEKLPERDGGGDIISYSLGEIKLDHFDTFVGPRDGNSLSITNTYRPERVTVNLHVIKNWEDDNKTEERPDSIQIALYADDVMISDSDNLPVLTADDGWKYDFTDLPKYKSQNGQYREIDYKIVEVSEVADYTSSSDQSGYNWIITNTYVPQQREVTVIGGTTEDSPAFKNDTVRIKANDPTPGTFFCWESEDIGDDAFGDAAAPETTFTMPAKPVTVTAVYGKILIGPSGGTTSDPIPDQVYIGSDIEPKLKVELEGVDVALIEGTDYDVKYKNNKDAGPAEAIVTLKGKWKGSGSATFKITPADISTAMVTAADQVYNGTEHKPVPMVTWGGVTLTKDIDYTASYAGNKNAGNATVTVTGKGNFTGTASGTFAITPAKAAITVADASKVEGAADPAFTGKVEGLITDGDLGEITYSRKGSDEAPGTYKGVITAKYTDNPNYDVTVTDGDFTITKKPAEKPTYKAVSGSGGTYTKGSGKTLAFIYKRSAEDETTFSHFGGIEVDGKAVPEKDASGKANWTAKSGSVIIELQSPYLDTLAAGEHTLAAVFDDVAAATAAFTVKEATVTPTPTTTPTPTSVPTNTTAAPKTGDESNVLLWFLLICASLFVMFRIISLRNRRCTRTNR